MTSDRDKLLTRILSNLPSAGDLANVTGSELPNVISRSRITKRVNSNGIYFFPIDDVSRFIRNGMNILVSNLNTYLHFVSYIFLFRRFSYEIKLIVFSYDYFYNNFYTLDVYQVDVLVISRCFCCINLFRV